MHDGWMWGWHWIWWVFWIALSVAAIYAIVRFIGDRDRSPEEHETALDVLEKRYARGEISTEEYEERKQHLL